jgi:ParB family chromosome partitioning protein
VPAKFGLGKGLDALLPLKTAEMQNFGPDAPAGDLYIALDAIAANPEQPRKVFDEGALAELAASIKQHGVIEPVILEKGKESGFVIVAGERRCRAARLAGLSEVPAIIRDYSDEKRLEAALIENIQRADLNPIEEASAYRRLMDIGALSQDEAAAKVGKSRSTLANVLRLLKLPPEMQRALESGGITSGHARAILSLEKPEDQSRLFDEITAGSLSVREAEKKAAAIAQGEAERTAAEQGKGALKKRQSEAKKRDPDMDALEQRFIDALGTKVAIEGDFSHGTLRIDFYSMEDLDALLQKLTL